MRAEEGPGRSGAGMAGSQTLMRGLDVIEGVARGKTTLTPLSEYLGLTRSTTHRLATALVDRGYLAFTRGAGYRLGSKLLELGHIAHAQADLVQVARPHLETLAAASEDTIHLGVLDGDQALYLDKVPGQRRITISSRVGDRQPLTSTGLGKALMLDHPRTFWTERLTVDQRDGVPAVDEKLWHDRMQAYATAGYAFDLEENEDQIRCVAAPVRDASGAIVAAISVSSAAQYMNDDRMQGLRHEVIGTAIAISRDLGWRGKDKGEDDAAQG